METEMLSPDRIFDLHPLSEAAADYEIVRRAIGHIRGHWREQPDIEVIAEAAGVTPTDLHHLFRRWAGLTPKAFLQALTLDSARRLLRESFRLHQHDLAGPVDLVLIARHSIAGKPLLDVERDLLAMLRRAGLLRGAAPRKAS